MCVYFISLIQYNMKYTHSNEEYTFVEYHYAVSYRIIFNAIQCNPM